MADTKPVQVVALNEIAGLLNELSSSQLRAGLGLSADRGITKLADCDVRCGCNTRDCGCHGSVSAAQFEDFVSQPEFDAMRTQRIDDLKAQLTKLEKGR